MSGKNLTFKLVMDADTKNYVTNTKQAEEVTKKVFDTIRSEAEKVRVVELVKDLHDATEAISSLGDKSSISAQQIRDMSMLSQQLIMALKNELVRAQAELVKLSQTKASPEDIQNAINRVTDLKNNIVEVEAAFGVYETTAIHAMSGVDKAATKTISEVQKFTNVDLTNIITEAQNASRAIDSMGDGAVVSATEVERIGSLGATAIESLERELSLAVSQLKALSQSTDAVSLEEFNAATAKVNGLEDALNLTKTSFTDFHTKATNAMGGVSSSIDKASDSAKQAGHEIYSALGVKPPTVINDAIANLSKQLEDFKANSKMPAEEVARVTRLTEQEIARLKTELSGVETSSNKANLGMGTLTSGINTTKFAVTALVGAMATLGIGLGIRELAQAADSYTNLSARINIATKEGGNFSSAMAGVHQVALVTNSSLDATGSLFTRLNTVGKEIGISQQQVLNLTKAVTQAIQVGGGSAQASEAAVQQFIQAMQGGVLRGEEFNSIMENGYGLAEALAKGLGVTTGELRKMAENGELSSERVIKAVQSQADSIQKTYDQFPLTISNALQKIATSWQILIGEMDQAKGASATAAQALSVIADNLGIIKVFFDDVGEGFAWFGNKLAEIDPSTLETIKTTLSEVYATIKTLIISFAEMGETVFSAFTSALDAMSPLFSTLLSGGEDVGGFNTLLNALRIGLGLVSDAATGVNIALKLVLASLQFVSAGVYALSSAVLGFLGFDDLAAQAQNVSDRLFAQAEKNATEAKRIALESKSATQAAIADIRKTEEEKNQERIVDNQKTIDELVRQEQAHAAAYKAISDERIKLNQQLSDARATGNQAAIDIAVKGLAELDAKEKAFQAESQKITEAKITAAQAVANAMIASADAAGIAQLKVLNAQLAAQGLKAEFDTTGQVIVKAMGDGAVAIGVTANAADKARIAASALGIDLDVALNRVSKKFASDKSSLNDYANGLETMGVTGKKAADITYEAWLKWLATAKNQAEIDFAKSKLKEFGDQGRVSTSQVEQGLFAIKLQAQKLPDDIDPVTAAFKRLGVETKENLKLAAQQALMDFISIRDSGKATAEGVQKAYESMTQKVAASGDVGVIAAANVAGANRDLRIEVDSTGKATVKSGSDMETSMHRVRDAAYGARQGFRDLGQTAREEAKSSTEAWNDAMKAMTGKMHETVKGEKTRLAFTESEVAQQLKDMGYDNKRATAKAKEIIENSKSGDGYKNASSTWLAKNGLDVVGSFAGGGGGTSNANYIREQLEQYSQYANVRSGEVGPVSTRRLEITNGSQTASLSGSGNDVDVMEKMLSEFEMLKKGM
ncbi:tape measure protein [Acinetobacter sp. ANC 4648]|uniref:tape measure protein n=1 Tax=Acinetobacter sp. ANC 4648 TaxID=1977875 RepID=UPI000A345502|nr:tape measure protein [Acinetobacter sp. ANC 4648]OTG79413.1 tape measure domain-containing protein [Acinetobacter sp. ANC 4648]